MNWENYRHLDGALDLVQALLDTVHTRDTTRVRKAIEFLCDLEDRASIRSLCAANTALHHAKCLALGV